MTDEYIALAKKITDYLVINARASRGELSKRFNVSYPKLAELGRNNLIKLPPKMSKKSVGRHASRASSWSSFQTPNKGRAH